jgi:hypothetical protein
MAVVVVLWWWCCGAEVLVVVVMVVMVVMLLLLLLLLLVVDVDRCDRSSFLATAHRGSSSPPLVPIQVAKLPPQERDGDLSSNASTPNTASAVAFAIAHRARASLTPRPADVLQWCCWWSAARAVLRNKTKQYNTIQYELTADNMKVFHSPHWTAPP